MSNDEKEPHTYFNPMTGRHLVISEPDAAIELTVLDYPPIRIPDVAWAAFVRDGYRVSPRPVPSIEPPRRWWQFWRHR
jgi:hypothetical protein